MDFDFDEKLSNDKIKTLRTAFDWTDIDGDGLITREDLKLFSGLKSDLEAESIFRLLKESSGGSPDDLYLTFEEYCKSVMDFPCLLDQLNQELQSRITSDIEEEDFESSTEFDELRFISNKLKRILEFYLNLLELKLDPVEIQDYTIDQILDHIVKIVEISKDTFAKEYPDQFIQGSLKMCSVIRELNNLHMKTVSEMNLKIRETESDLKNSLANISKLNSTNARLTSQVLELEFNNQKVEEINMEILQEKEILIKKIEKNEDEQGQKIDYSDHLKEIELIIKSKEDEILSLDKKRRRLESYKALQEIQKKSKQNSESLMLKLNRQKTLNLGIMKRTISEFSNPIEKNFNSKIKKFQIQKNEEIILAKNDKIEELTHNLNKMSQVLEVLKQENSVLRQKIKFLDEHQNKNQSVGWESAVIPSLYEEINFLRDSSEPESFRSEENKNRPQPKIYKDVSTQTHNVTKTYNTRPKRSCFDWL